MLQHTKTFWTMLCFQLCGNSLGKALFYSNTTVLQCTKQGPKIHAWMSPGLNPTKHLWNELERRLSSRPTSVPDLINALQNEWAPIPTEKLQNQDRKSVVEGKSV